MYHFMKEMTDTQKVLFAVEHAARRKDPATAMLLTLFTGAVGGHRFYMEQNGLGALYVLFCWAFIPAIIALIETLMIRERAERFNNELAQLVARQVKEVTQSV